MLQTLPPIDGGASSRSATVKVPAPHYFRPIVGEPRDVSIAPSQTYQRASGRSAAQKNGLRYEENVQRTLLALDHRYLASPFVRFSDDSGQRYCVPDGVLDSAAGFVVYEVKFQHTADAWWQLRKLYQPVLEKLKPVRVVEICHIYDPATPFPEPVQLSLDLAAQFDRDIFGVIRWTNR